MTNSGAVAGDDVVQLYATTPDATAGAGAPAQATEGLREGLARPRPDQDGRRCRLKIADLAFFNQSSRRWVVDPGRYGLQIARSSDDADVEQETEITVGGTLDAGPGGAERQARARRRRRARHRRRARIFPEGAVDRAEPDGGDEGRHALRHRAQGPGPAVPGGHDASPTRATGPSVVKVDGDGTIRTVRNGVATVTASVTYGGVTRSTRFVVRVVSLLDGITVNGKPLGDVQPQSPFRPDTFHYEVVVPDDVAAVPTVAATRRPSGERPGRPGRRRPRDGDDRRHRARRRSC